MRETEITVRVFDEREKIDEILKAQGFEMTEQYQLNDWYFSKIEDVTEVGYAELMKNSVLVRTSGDKASLCYKNKEVDAEGNVVSEEKIETAVDDLNKAILILRSAGLNNYCTVENHSYVYKKGDVCFALQVIKDLGIFIEYEEDESMRDLPVREKLARLTETVKGLGLHLGDDFSCKKVYLLLKKNA